MARCEVSTTNTERGRELVLRGAADVATARALRDRLVEVLHAEGDVVVRLDELERLDGAGLQLLIGLRRALAARGRSCTIAAGECAARRAIETAGATALVFGASS